EKIERLGLILQFPKGRVLDLIKILAAGTNRFLLLFVEDAWILYSGEDAGVYQQFFLDSFVENTPERAPPTSSAKKVRSERKIQSVMKETLGRKLKKEVEVRFPGAPTEGAAIEVRPEELSPPEEELPEETPASFGRMQRKSLGEHMAETKAAATAPQAEKEAEKAAEREEAVRTALMKTLVKKTRFKKDQYYAWIPAYIGMRERKLYALWQTSKRIARCARLGDYYYLNTKYAAWARRKELSWDRIDRDLTFLRIVGTYVRPIPLPGENEEFVLRMVAPPPHMADLELSSNKDALVFCKFWEDINKRSIRLLEWRGGYMLFRDRQNESVEVSGEAGVGNEELLEISSGEVLENQEGIENPEDLENAPGEDKEFQSELGLGNEGQLPEASEEVLPSESQLSPNTGENETSENTTPPATGNGEANEAEQVNQVDVDILVKSSYVLTNLMPYCCGLQGYLDLCSEGGRPLRYFTFSAQDEVVEHAPGYLQEMIPLWLNGQNEKIDEIVGRILRLRNEMNLNVDLLLGDIFTNLLMIASSGDPDTIDDILDDWIYDDGQQQYVSLLPVAESLNLVKNLQKVAEKRGVKTHTAIIFTKLAKFVKEYPDAANRLSKRLDQMRDEMGPDEEQEGLTTFEKDFFLGTEGGISPSLLDPRRHWEEIGRGKDYVEYLDEDGGYHIEEPEDFDAEAYYNRERLRVHDTTEEEFAEFLKENDMPADYVGEAPPPPGPLPPKMKKLGFWARWIRGEDDAES
ncbi:MAG TPA: hypothetical protein VKK79_25455, partial [Candidatus Lokiarchaeia archaeon]|nr:hypothetical protein [Candidatus Lokiarchaeia archaeon]